MSATYARVTPSLHCGNPNATRTDERPVQLTWTDGHVTQTDGHVNNPALYVRATARTRDYICARMPKRATTYARDRPSERLRMRATTSARDDVYSRRRVSLGACSCLGGAHLD